MHKSKLVENDNRNISDFFMCGAKSLDIDLPYNALTLFEKYFDFLDKKSKIINLTSITGTENVAQLHFLDSISLLNIEVFKNKRIIDIGSGAGFPGVPIKIAEPSIDLTLLDAIGKRVNFLLDLSTILNLDFKCIHARAEEVAHDMDFREKYDIAVSRAVGHLNIICEICLPFVCIGGMFIAMKGINSADEIAEASNAIKVLGAQLEKSHNYTIPGTDISHNAVIIRKMHEAPNNYPRRNAKIQRTPL